MQIEHFFRRIKNLPCFDRTNKQTGNKLIGLIDTGATNNYVSTNNTEKAKLIKLKNSIFIKTIHGYSEISHYVKINLFSYDLIFFVLDYIGNFDLILGMDGLRRIHAKIDLMSFKLSYKSIINIQTIHYSIQTNVREQIKNEIDRLILKNNNSPSLPYNTSVIAEIRTMNDCPIWTKQFPYPMSSNDFVNNEIDTLLKNGIIQKSHSPYNSPIWIVPKKGFNEDGTQKKRLVIDYQNLNTQTIFDRYPMPDINSIINNLGGAKFFSKIDLESGYHQILLRKTDREKTSFSVNGAKYEFTRLPFGLKNAPSIFQRAVDDILRPFIGKFAYVYMDDVIIFSKSEEEHFEHIMNVIKAFTEAHMRISSEKSFFFEQKIEFLGHIISQNKIMIDPKKVDSIKNYQIPSTLRQLRGFLGLASQCRRFIRDYAKIVRPLSILLGNENGRIGAKCSSKVKIELDNHALDAFNLIRSKIQEHMELCQPNYSKPFELTTDASGSAIGGCLSQGEKIITFVSRTLNKSEQQLATNERELLPIVWALRNLRNYLYGIADVTIFTDHQPLISAVTNKNTNLMIKRWKSFVEDSGAKIQYKPGNKNIIADALSRQYCNFTEEIESDHSSPSSPETDSIRRVAIPLNFYKNQFHIQESTMDELKTETLFPDYVLHNIKFSSIDSLIQYLKLTVTKNRLNAIHATEEIFHQIRDLLRENLPQINFVFTTKLNRNISDPNEQEYLIITEHERAHRNFKENFAQLRENYFFPKMKKRIRAHAIHCEICKKQKYETHPKKQIMVATPIPTFVGESIQIDIFYIGGKIYYSVIDRFSKFVFFRFSENKLNSHEVVEEILQFFPRCKSCMTDNEAIFTSFPMQSLFKRKKIIHTHSPIRHSISNAQIERNHRTIIEIARCLAEQNSLSFEDAILRAVSEYNNSIHSVIRAKPIDVFYHSENFPNIPELIKTAQESMLNFQNERRDVKIYLPGDVIFVKNNRRDKRSQTFTKHIVGEDRGMMIITDKMKKVHKDDIRSG